MSKLRIVRFIVLLAVAVGVIGGPRVGNAVQVYAAAGGAGCWSVVPTPAINAQYSEITAMSAPAADNVWVVGSASSASAGGNAGAFAMRYNGSGWQVTSTKVVSEAYVLRDVAAVAPDDVWAVGSFAYAVPKPGNERGKLILHWDGKAWKVSLKGNVGELNGIWATSADDIWVVGESGRSGQGGVAVVHHWDGSAWSETPIGTQYLNDVTALSADDVWVAGSAIYHWDGRQWAISKAEIREKYGLLEVGARDVWAVGQGAAGSEALHWNGQDWSALATVADTQAQLRSVAGYGANDLWAAGGYEGGALLAHWDGSKWAGVPNPIPGFHTELNSVIKVGNDLWAGGKRTMRAGEGSEPVIVKHTQTPCPAPGPETPLNPPVPLPGSEKLPFATGKSIDGVFLRYWQTHGGLEQQGYPITNVQGEVSDLDGKVYTVQYFERAIFEYHPELKGTVFEVLLSQLGTFQYERKYPNGAPNQRPNQDPGTLYFPETGKKLGGSFLKYWQAHGGLQQQGYPISDEFTEVSDANGRPYTVQYFERSVFEWHPENAPPYNVLLSLLGNFRYNDKYVQGSVAPGSEPRLIASNVQGGIVRGGGKYLAWNETPASGSAIRVYNAEQNRLVAATASSYTMAGADDHQVAWRVGENLVGVYNAASGATYTVTVPTQQLAPSVQKLGEFALDSSLYYSYRDTAGKYAISAQDLITRWDSSISIGTNEISGLKAGNGFALWTEAAGTGGATEESLHIYDARTRRTVTPASGIGAFSGYGAWGDWATWSFYDTIGEQITYLFNLRTNGRKVLATGPASGPVIGYGKVAWVKWPDIGHGETGGWDIELFDIAAGTTSTAVQGLGAMPSNVMLVEGDKLAFTVDLDLGSAGYDLYLVDLGR